MPPSYRSRTYAGTTIYSSANLTQSQISARQGAVGKELPVFSGAVEEWPMFIRMFERSTELCGFSEAENLLRLQRALIGEAKESVGHLLLLPDGLNEVMETLEVQFGRPDQIIEATVEKVRRMPAPNPGCLRSLAKFGFSVRNMCATIEALKLPEYAYDVALLRELVSKLPSEAALDWARYKRQLRFVSLSEFGHWISQLARDASDAIVDPPSRNANEQRIIDDASAAPLTPNDILLGSSDGSKPPIWYSDTSDAVRSMWRSSQLIADVFWKKWVSEYLPTLARRTKWFKPARPIQEGDVVIVVDECLPRNCWPKGRVVSVVRAKDGQVRQAVVRTQKGFYKRPATKLAVLDVRGGKTEVDFSPGETV
uniref:Uncharacterized protein n=1 Tax=Anopheles arabiensis TaxID=7173 RepID=A0A182HQT5_ANOAR